MKSEGQGVCFSFKDESQPLKIYIRKNLKKKNTISHIHAKMTILKARLGIIC